MDLRATDTELRTWHDALLEELKGHATFRTWITVCEVLDARKSLPSHPEAPSLSSRAREIQARVDSKHSRKQATSALKDEYLRRSVEIYLSTGNEPMRSITLVELLAETGVIAREGPRWKVAANGMIHQWMKWDKDRFVEVDAARKLWALRPDYYATLKSRAA